VRRVGILGGGLSSSLRARVVVGHGRGEETLRARGGREDPAQAVLLLRLIVEECEALAPEP